MSLATFTQSTIWTASDFGVDIAADYLTGNVSGLGVSQYAAFTNGGAASVIGRVYAITVQAPIPPPAWYITTAAAADVVTIQTPAGTLVELESFIAGVGFNGQYFQPSAGGVYIIYFRAGSVVATGGVFFNVQSVLQNTLGQYINLSTISFGKSPDELKMVGAQQPLVGTTIALNTTSAIPNTLTIDFVNYPMQRGLNTLASLRVLISTSGVQSFGNDFLSTIGAASETVTMIAGSWHPINYYSPRKMSFTGRASLTVQTVGITIVPATTVNYAVPNMFPELLANQPSMLTEAEETADMSTQDLSGIVAQLKSMSLVDNSRIINSRVDGLEDQLDRLCKTNADAHARICDSLTSLAHMMKYPVREPRRESTVSEIQESSVDREGEVVDAYLAKMSKSRM